MLPRGIHQGRSKSTLDLVPRHILHLERCNKDVADELQPQTYGWTLRRWYGKLGYCLKGLPMVSTMVRVLSIRART